MKDRREQNNRWHKNRRQELKLAVLAVYGPNCACCGESAEEFLTVDHVAGNGAEHRRRLKLGGTGKRGSTSGGWTFYRWLVNQGFPKGYRILCWNCNCSLGIRGYCPHGNVKIEASTEMPAEPDQTVLAL